MPLDPDPYYDESRPVSRGPSPQPDNPHEPLIPGLPVVPHQPHAPEFPVVPHQPLDPELPVVPHKPLVPGQPEGPLGGPNQANQIPNINVLRRKMSIAKGCLDIGLLSANANQLRNILNFGDRTSTLYYLILSSIIISLILQVSAGILLMVAEKFDLEDDDEQDWGDILNSVTTILVFIVLIINVFIASLGVDVASPSMYAGTTMRSFFPQFI